MLRDLSFSELPVRSGIDRRIDAAIFVAIVLTVTIACQSERPQVDRPQELSVQAKHAFSVVGLLATVLVVGIHYKSHVPDQPDAALASWNQLAQEFWFGGVARVAVPVFAFAAGLFYFRSDDGSWASYRTKLHQRFRSVVMPYFIIGSIAMVFWLLFRRLEGKPIEFTPVQFVVTWLLRPPAEQLWFLRDLILLVAAAPVIRWCCAAGFRRWSVVGLVATAWALDWQAFPIVAGWRALQMETLLFFMIGCIAVDRTSIIQRVGSMSMPMLVASIAAWFALVVARINVRADFDIWYADDHGWADLLLHQASILVGVVAIFAIAWRLQRPWLVRLSGGSFFVYLVHEFPVRAAAHRISDRVIDHDWSCWVLAPMVLAGSFAAVMLMGRFAPSALGLLTGGRVPPATVVSKNVVSGVRT